MMVTLFRAIFVFPFAVVCFEAIAHETPKKVAPKPVTQGVVLELSIMVNQNEPAPAAQIPKGTSVHLSVLGTGDHELHLHGYDITSTGQGNSPAVFVFQAIHTGRYAIVMHGAADFLGRTEKAVVYLEIREP
ncbi:hypothetical protein A9Q94_15680 [Rhodobacterales bacterium 56_14_T64]|nr:hypothetical protein A9Q94_15680 [Rhodobacterales bacterium 56_14_T64]